MATHKRRKRRAASFTPEALESRTLLTTVSLRADDGALLIEGTNRSENVEVSQNGDVVLVEVEGGQSTEFDAADVTAIGFVGKGGNDYFRNRTAIQSYLVGGDGNDTLIGGSSADILDGGSGDDDLRGSGGGDSMYGGSGDDIMKGGRGKDRMDGGDDDDSMRGGRGSDSLAGGDGDDTLRGDKGADELNGDAGNDFLNGGDGVDELRGGDGEDTLNGGGFDNDKDYLHGGNGADLFHQWGELGSSSKPTAPSQLLGEDAIADLFTDDGIDDRVSFHKRPKWRDRIVAPPVGPVATVGIAADEGVSGGAVARAAAAPMSPERKKLLCDTLRGATKRSADALIEAALNNASEAEIARLGRKIEKAMERLRAAGCSRASASLIDEIIMTLPDSQELAQPDVSRAPTRRIELVFASRNDVFFAQFV